MTNDPNWRNEMQKARTELGNPGVLALYWFVVAAVLWVAAIPVSGGIPGVFNTIIILLAAVPIALGAGWLTARGKKK